MISTKYKILTSRDPGILEQRMNEASKDGWSPSTVHGTFQIVDTPAGVIYIMLMVQHTV